MKELTITAELVAAGVGLPPRPYVWVNDIDRGTLVDHGSGSGWVCDQRHKMREERFYNLLLDLSDPQTAFGVALRLDAWERAMPVRTVSGGHQGKRWAWQVELHANGTWTKSPRCTRMLVAMIACLTQIGMDAAVRRALGESPIPEGTLGALHHSRDAWTLTLRDGRALWWEFPGITDPDEVLAAIYAELCRK